MTDMQIQKRADSGLEAAYRVWKRRKWLAIGVWAFCFVTSASFVVSLPNIYRATATVLLGGLGAQDEASNPGQGAEDSRLDPVTEEVMSRDRLAGLITRYDLYADLRRELSLEAAIARMRQDIRVDRKVGDERSGRIPTYALEIGFQGIDPVIVAQVTNALVASFVSENNSIRANQAENTAASLESQLTSIKQKLDSQEQRIDAFRNAHLGELPEQQSVNLATLQQLNAQLQENSASEIQVMTRREDLLKQMADAGDADMNQLEQELASLRTRYTDKYPDIVKLQAQIAMMKREQTAQGGADAHRPLSPLQQQFQAIDSELSSYKQQDDRLRAQIAAYQGRVESVPMRAQQLQALSQGYNETQDVYSTLLKQYEQAKLAQASQNASGDQYSVLDPAVVPREASGPARMRLILMVLILSIGLAAGAVLAAEQLNVSFHSVEELRVFTTLPVLASVPQIITRSDVWKSRLRSGFVTLSFIAVMLITAEGSRILGHGSAQFVWMIARHG